MLAYIVRRLLLLPLILLGVTLLIFALLQLLSPYQRLSLYVQEGSLQRYTPEQLERLIELHGLRDPIWVQYARWLGNVVRGDLGWSETDSRPVAEALLSRLPATAELALLAILPLVLVGISLGILAAVHHNRALDHLTRVFSILGYAFPTFVFGLLGLMIFYGKLGWFPPGRLSEWANQVVHSPEFVRYTGLNTLDALLNGRLDVFLDALRHLALPVLTLSYVSWALIVRITRSSMLEALRQEYVTVARAKGQREVRVVLKHAARNALIPVVTISGLVFAGWLSGVVITETIFNYRGLGQFVADAAIALDIPSVLGFALFAATVLVVMNLLVDVLYALIDPRVRLE